jgi:hypothetical protein
VTHDKDFSPCVSESARLCEFTVQKTTVHLDKKTHDKCFAVRFFFAFAVRLTLSFP